MTDQYAPDQYAPDRMRERLEVVERGIQQAADRAGRHRRDVTLIAVSKNHPPAALQALYAAGVRDFGESYVQEWQDKAPTLPDDIRWHFVGHLQSNKAKYIVDSVAMVHSVDRRSVMKQLQRRSSGGEDAERVDVLLQVNIADQDSKSGVDPGDVPELLETTLDYPDLRVRGLMTIPPYVDDPEDNRPHFRRMAELFAEANDWMQVERPGDAAGFEHLSMGMTNDYGVAIEEGATLIRVGTALFGPRRYDD